MECIRSPRGGEVSVHQDTDHDPGGVSSASGHPGVGRFHCIRTLTQGCGVSSASGHPGATASGHLPRQIHEGGGGGGGGGGEGVLNYIHRIYQLQYLNQATCYLYVHFTI